MNLILKFLLVFFFHLLRFYNTLIITNFNILKYIKKIFKLSIQYIFNAYLKSTPKQLIKNLNYINLQKVEKKTQNKE